MKINPTQMFIVLAVAAVAAVVGVTRDRWLPAGPANVAEVEISKTDQPATILEQAVPEAPAVKQEEQVTAQQPTVAQEQVTAEQPASTTAELVTEVAAAPETETTTEPAAVANVETPKVVSAAPSATTEVEDSAAATTPQDTAAAESAEPAGTVPSFDTVRIEKTGEALIAGRAAAGSEVTVMLDGKSIGTATANADGAFVVTSGSPLPPGSGALTIESRKSNETIVQKSEQAVAVIVPAVETKQEALVAVISPDQPTKVLQKAEPAVEAPKTENTTAATVAEQPATPAIVAVAAPLSLDAVDYDEGGNIVFSGRSAAGATARLYVDNQIAGEAKADDTGRWTFSGSAPIATGKHTLRVDGLDVAGAVMGRVELPFFREEQTKVESAAPEQSAAQTTTAVSTTTQTKTEVATAVAVPDIPKPKDGRVVIQPGNNLWRISRVIYGSGTKFTVLFEANKDQIKDPDLIYPGQVFMTPDVVPPEMIDPANRDPLKPDEGAAAVQ